MTDYDEVRGVSSWFVACNGVYEVYTSPFVADADGDTLNDAVEKTKLTDPHKVDTDGDGIADKDDNFNDCPEAAGPIISKVHISQRGEGIVAAGDVQANVEGAHLGNITIDWGDGTNVWDSGVLNVKNYSFNEANPPSHNYMQNGVYTLTITSTDDVAVTPNTAEQTFDVDWKSNISFSGAFDAAQGWHNGRHARMVADTTGDGKDDLIGFADGGVHVAPALADGSGFGPAEIWHDDASSTIKLGFNSPILYAGWDSLNTAFDVRNVADVNNDGKADIVVFGADGVYVGISNGSLFNVGERWFNTNYDLRNIETPSTLGDIDGDGDLDWIHFGVTATSCHKNEGGSFATGVDTPQFAFNYGWRVGWHPRFLADIDGDSRADVLGFDGGGVVVGLSNGDCTFAVDITNRVLDYFSPAQGWNTWDHPRIVKDINGDGKADILGFSGDTVRVALNTSEGGVVSFGAVETAIDINQFSVAQGWRTYYGSLLNIYYNVHPRILADIDGDGDQDIVGFAGDGVGVGLNDGTGKFTLVWHWTNQFTLVSEWVTNATTSCDTTYALSITLFGNCNNNWFAYRTTGDVNGDGATDLIGFGNSNVLIVPGILISESLF